MCMPDPNATYEVCSTRPRLVGWSPEPRQPDDYPASPGRHEYPSPGRGWQPFAIHDGEMWWRRIVSR